MPKPDLLSLLFHPRAVALVGASADPTKNTARPQRFLARHGYAGTVYPINPNRDEVLGVRAYPDVESLPGPVDHAFVMVPAAAVPGVVAACGRAGIPLATIYSDGFAETGAEGARRQRELVAIARTAGVRLVGPNSMGVIDVRSGTALTVNAVLERAEPRAGGVSVISQSGSVIGALLSRGHARGLGFARLVSIGNECDVGVGEVLDALAGDAETDVVLLFLEGIRDAPALAAAARRAHAAGKAVIAYKLGRSETGRRLAATHSGAMTGGAELAGAFFARHGIAHVDLFETLIEAPALLAGRAPARGRRVAVLTTTGGGAATVADRLGSLGVELVPPPADLVARMRVHRVELGARSIVDLTMTGARREVFTEALECLIESAECDAIAIVVGSSGLFQPELAVRPIVDAARAAKPLAVFVLPDAPRSLELLAAAGVAAFRTPEGCADALRAYLDWRAPGTAGGAAPAGIDAHLRDAGSLDEARSLALFAALGVPVAPHAVVPGPGEPAGVPFPVAVKILSADIAHKTEAGGVELDVADDGALHAACRRIADRVAESRPDAHLEGFLVQRMEHGLAEAIVAYRLDPEVGPVVSLGLGGTLAEIYRDVVVRCAPVDPGEAREMVERVRGLAPIRGYRGLPRGDCDALAAAVVALSRLAGAAPVLEAEINPLVVRAEGEGVVAVDGVVVVGVAA